MLTWNEPRPTHSAAQKKAAAHCGAAAKVTMDRHAPQRDIGIVEGCSPSNSHAFSSLSAEQHAFITAIAVRFGVEVDVWADAGGSISFCVQQDHRRHRFATIDQVESFLMRSTGVGTPARLEFDRGYEARHTFYRDAQKHFDATGDSEVSEVFAKRLLRPPVRLNALDLFKARVRAKAADEVAT